MFLLLIGVQAAHSIEEYEFGLYNVLAPARFISGLLSNNLAVGFFVINAMLVADKAPQKHPQETDN